MTIIDTADRTEAPLIEPKPIHIRSVTVTTSTEDPKVNDVAVLAVVDGVERKFEHTGEANGPIDAMCKAFRPLIDFRWMDLQIKAATRGEDAMANVRVLLARNGGTFDGQSAHTNTMHAVAQAIALAIDRMRWHEFVQARSRRR